MTIRQIEPDEYAGSKDIIVRIGHILEPKRSQTKYRTYIECENFSENQIEIGVNNWKKIFLFLFVSKWKRRCYWFYLSPPYWVFSFLQVLFTTNFSTDLRLTLFTIVSYLSILIPTIFFLIRLHLLEDRLCWFWVWFDAYSIVVFHAKNGKKPIKSKNFSAYFFLTAHSTR